jgi:hypothetical protein
MIEYGLLTLSDSYFFLITIITKSSRDYLSLAQLSKYCFHDVIVFIVKARRVVKLPGLICIASQVIFYVKRNRWRRLANAGYHQAQQTGIRNAVPVPEGLAAYFSAYSHIVYEYISSTALSVWGSVLISVFWPLGFRRYA